MSLGLSLDDLGWLFVLAIPAFLLPFALMGVGKLLGRLLRVGTDWFPFAFMVAVLLGVLMAGSLWLDAAGQRVKGVVYSKEEQLTIREQGDWQQDFSVSIRYRLDGASPSTELIPAADDGGTGLRLDPVRFDQLREGEMVDLKVLPLWRSLTLVRLAELSTREMIPWRWLGYGLLIVAAGLMVWRVGRTQLGVLLVVLVGIVAVFGIWGANVFVRWRAAEGVSNRPLRGEATVEEVTRITVIDYLPCHSDCDDDYLESEFEVPQEYDIVKMRFVPAGGGEPLTVVASADEGTVPLEFGGKVTVAYAADNPRDVVIVGATHNHHWRNPLGFLESMGWQLALLVAVFVVWGWLAGAGRWLWRRLLRRRSQLLAEHGKVS